MLVTFSAAIALDHKCSFQSQGTAAAFLPSSDASNQPRFRLVFAQTQWGPYPKDTACEGGRSGERGGSKNMNPHPKVGFPPRHLFRVIPKPYGRAKAARRPLGKRAFLVTPVQLCHGRLAARLTTVAHATSRVGFHPQHAPAPPHDAPPHSAPLTPPPLLPFPLLRLCCP